MPIGRLIWLLASFLLLSSLLARTQSDEHLPREGRITGAVIDADGNPAQGVVVSAIEEGLSFSSVVPNQRPTENKEHRKSQAGKRYSKWLELEAASGPMELHEGITNNYGEFEIGRLETGSYSLYGERDDLYPLARLTLIDGSPGAATLTSQTLSARLILRLGSRGGVVSGSVKDKQTGHLVEAGFDVLRGDDNQQWIAASARSEFRFLIPSELNVTLRVSADGYKTLSVPIRLEPGRHRVLNLELAPEEGWQPAPDSRR
jgi:hypothetical protein